MALPKIFLDKRGTVNGKDSHINLSNFINLNAHIVAVITAQLNTLYSFENALTLSGNTVSLGGLLNQDTTIDGNLNAQAFNFDNLSEFNVIAEGIVLQGSSSVNLQTPDVIALAASAGQVLTLIDGATGECEWQDIPPTTVEVNNGLNIDGGVVQLGGDLVEDTVVSGDANTFSLSFYFLNEFNINSVVTTLASDELVVSIPSTASTEVGWVLSESVDAGGNAVWHANNVFPIETILVNTQLNDTNGTLIVEPAAGNINISLPDATLNHGLTYTIKQVGTGTVAIASSAQDIYDTAQVPSKTLSVPGETVRIQAHATADGGNGLWYII